MKNILIDKLTVEYDIQDDDGNVISKKKALEGLTFENTKLKITSQWNGSTVSFINIIPKQKTGNISGSYITIADQDGIVWIEGLGTNKRCRVTNLTKTVAVIYSSEIYKKSAEENKDEV